MQTFTICASQWIFSRKLNNYHIAAAVIQPTKNNGLEQCRL
jgi:hypothetical protein